MALSELLALDLPALREERLARLQSSMLVADVDAALLLNPANVRYATGTSVMAVYTMSTFVRCALVPAEGTPILYEHPNSMFLSSRVAPDVRPMIGWEFLGPNTDDMARAFARLVADGMRELGVDGSPVAVDRLGVAAFLALDELGVALRDSGPITLAARQVKTAQEIRLMEVNGAMMTELLADFERSIAPGVTENDLLAVLTGSLLRRGGEYLITRAVVSGPNTNPWNLEASNRSVEPGDLVFVDTDAIGIEGYLTDVSRTFLVGGDATPAQREAYRLAHEQVRAMVELVEPGRSFEEFARLTPPLPEPYARQRYETLVHGAGLEDEGPNIPFPDDPDLPMPDGALEPGMVLCLESYVGAPGARDGVKLEDQVLVTDAGAKELCPFPYADRLLA